MPPSPAMADEGDVRRQAASVPNRKSISLPSSGPRAAARPFRVAYLSASSGGGHDGVARAMSALASAAFGSDVEQYTIDLYGGSSLKLLPRASRIRYRSDLLWRLYYRSTDRRWIVRLLVALLRPLALRWLRSQLPTPPDALVAVHFGAAQYLEPLARSFSERPRTAVVVTDYVPHWAWFAKADAYVVPSAFAVERSSASGMSPSTVIALPVLPCQRPPTQALQRKQLRPERFLVVAVAGSDGTSEERLTRILLELDARDIATRLTVDVVCGRGDSLHRAMTQLAPRLERLELRPLGFVHDLPSRLAAADLALLRASPQALTEALAAGTPVAAFDWHVHEEPNARLVESLGGGVASRSPRTIADALDRAFTESSVLDAWQSAARSVARDAPGESFVRDLFARLGAAPARTRAC